MALAIHYDKLIDEFYVKYNDYVEVRPGQKLYIDYHFIYEHLDEIEVFSYIKGCVYLTNVIY